jgi:putative FmdB family regulatory protein
MPIYEYSCTACDHRFEELVSGTRTLVACPSCTSPHVQKLLSTFSTAGIGGDMPSAQSGGGGGGCCGGGCGCGR